MKKQLLINAGLLAAILALGLIAWLKPPDSGATLKVSALKIADVKSLEIVVGSAPATVLDRTADGWQITRPIAARAESILVNRLLELLDAKATERFPATGLARYGLNEPYAQVRIGAQQFSFGAVNEMSREQYVSSGDDVYLLSLRYAAALPKSPMDLVSKQLFAADEAPGSFDFGAFKVEQGANQKWTLTTPGVATSDAGPDDINRWVDGWRLAGALGVQAPTPRKPVGAIDVILKNGTPVTVSILETGAKTVIARSDQPFEYVLAAQSAKLLLAPPAAAQGATPPPK